MLDRSGTCLIRREFKNLCRKLRGADVVLYQSTRSSDNPNVTTGYFARAIIGDEFSHPTDPRLCIVILEQLTYLDRTAAMINDDGSGPEKRLFDASSQLIGWRAAKDLRTLSPDEFAAIVGSTQLKPAELDEPPAPYVPEVSDIVPLPLFGTRPYRVRDARFARAIYDAYGGRCAISGLTMLSPDGKECSLEAVHWYPFSLEPRNTIPSGGLLAPSWHARIDSGAVLIQDDYTWSAPVEDADTRAIQDRRLLLPMDRAHWPDVQLLRRKRQLLGFQ
jgi:hypothetical protein